MPVAEAADPGRSPKSWISFSPSAPHAFTLWQGQGDGAALSVHRVRLELGLPGSVEDDLALIRAGEFTLEVEADTAAFDRAMENVRQQIIGAMAGGVEAARRDLEQIVLGPQPRPPDDDWSIFGSGPDAMTWTAGDGPDEEVPRWLA